MAARKRGTSRSLRQSKGMVGGAVRRLGRLAGWDIGGIRNCRRGTAAPVCGGLAEPFGTELGSSSGTCLSRGPRQRKNPGALRPIRLRDVRPTKRGRVVAGLRGGHNSRRHVGRGWPQIRPHGQFARCAHCSRLGHTTCRNRQSAGSLWRLGTRPTSRGTTGTKPRRGTHPQRLGPGIRCPDRDVRARGVGRNTRRTFQLSTPVIFGGDRRRASCRLLRS